MSEINSLQRTMLMELILDHQNGEDFSIPLAQRFRLLMDYGEKVHRLISPPDGCVAAVYVWSPYVWIIPGRTGAPSGVFLEDFGTSSEFAGVRLHKPEKKIWDYCNINAFIDGRNAYAEILSFSMR